MSQCDKNCHIGVTLGVTLSVTLCDTLGLCYYLGMGKIAKIEKLSPTRERFAQAVANGMTQSDAYRQAYHVKPTTKPGTIWTASSMLMRLPEVASRVAQLRAKIEKKALWTREDSIRTMMAVISDPDNKQSIINAVKVINDMHGFNAPIKQDIAANVLIQSIQRVIVDHHITNTDAESL